MKTAEEMMLSRLELIGRISVLSAMDKWKDIESLLKQRDDENRLDAFRAGMMYAAKMIAESYPNLTPEEVAADVSFTRDLPEQIKNTISNYATSLKELPEV